MGIAPFKISDGRVLIITPQTIIRDSVLGSLDPTHPRNFWIFSKVFDEIHQLPTLIEYEKTLTDEIIHQADIVVLNVHKLQERLDSSLIKRVNPDFFDMIIVDEAPHAEAKTWKRAIEYFEESKVLEVTFHFLLCKQQPRIFRETQTESFEFPQIVINQSKKVVVIY